MTEMFTRHRHRLMNRFASNCKLYSVIDNSTRKIYCYYNFTDTLERNRFTIIHFITQLQKQE